MNNKELEFICKEGEGQFIEFKEKPDRSLAGEMVAFANAGGGKIFIGITNEGQAIGFDATNRERSRSRILQITATLRCSLVLSSPAIF